MSQHYHYQVVKFADEDELPLPVTEVDIGVVQMQAAVTALETQVDELQKQIAEYVLCCRMAAVTHVCSARRTTKITTALRAGESRKPLALSHLRSRKQLEDLLGKRLGALDVLQAQLAAVERAVGDAEVRISATPLLTPLLTFSCS